MKSLKDYCSDVCYTLGFNQELWPIDVFEEVRRKKYIKVIDDNESGDNYDEFVGWLDRINYVNQQKNYVVHNLCTWLRDKHPLHKISLNILLHDTILYYNSGIEPLIK